MAEIQGLYYLLSTWKKMPDAPPSEYSSWSCDRDRHHPFSAAEIRVKREALRRMAPSSYFEIFPEERPGP